MNQKHCMGIRAAALFCAAVLLALGAGSAHAAGGDFVWAKAGDETGNFGFSGVLDGAGNIYTTGRLGGTTDFDPGIGIFNLTSVRGYDVFVSKLDANGDFVWAKAMGGAGDDLSFSVAVDGAGNVYTIGQFWETVDFDPGEGVFNLTAPGRYSIFVSKLDADGNFVWAKSMDVMDDGIIDISFAVGASGNVYTTGRFAGTMDFDPGAGLFNLTAIESGYSDIFVSKLDVNGNFVWAKNIGGSDNDYAFSVGVDMSENFYTKGHFIGTVDLDPGTGIFNFSGSGFLSKLDTNGNFVWANGGGYGNPGAVDAAGNYYSTGYFSGTDDFDPGAGNFNLSSAGYYDVFVSKLDTNGNFVWAKAMGNAIGGAGYNTEASGNSIAVNASGFVYITGGFTDTVDFDPGAGNFNLLSAGGSDIFVSRLDTNGNFVWAKSIGGPGYESGGSVAVDALGNAYTTGRFYGTVDFDPGVGIFNLTEVSPVGAGGTFLLKLSGGVAAEGEGEGEGEALPVISVSPPVSNIDFGEFIDELNTGDTVKLTVVVTNTGGGSLTGTLAIAGEGFSIEENPTFILGGGARSTYTILFSTIKKGRASGTLTISSNGGAPITLNLTANVAANSPFACGVTRSSQGGYGGDALLVLLCLLALGLFSRSAGLERLRQ